MKIGQISNIIEACVQKWESVTARFVAKGITFEEADWNGSGYNLNLKLAELRDNQNKTHRSARLVALSTAQFANKTLRRYTDR